MTDPAESRPESRLGLPAGWWARPLRHGALAFGVLLLAVVVAAVLGSLGRPTFGSALGRASLAPSLIHRVPLQVGPVTVRVALLLGTVGAGALLYRGARRSLLELGVPVGLRAALGAVIAVPYAAGSFLLAVAGLAVSPPVDGTAVTPSIPWAAVLPLLLAGACGAAGGVAAGAPGSAGERRVRAVAAEGWRMSWVAVALGSLGVLVVLALHPTAVRAFVDQAFRGGSAEGSLSLLGAALGMPNAGVGAATAAMGGSVDLQSGVGSCAIVSYTRFPGSESPGLGPCPGVPVSLGPPPPGYVLFLLIPLAATAVGGILAARRDGPRSSGSGAAIGAAAGVAFAAAFAGWCMVARVTADVSGPIGVLVPGLGVALGPSPVVGFLVALAWGAAGGAAGGWWEGRRTAAGPAEAGPARDDRIG